MQVGALVVQSPIRAANNGRQVNAAARAMRGDTRALALFSSPDAAARRARVESTAAWAEHGARGLPRMLREKGVWHLGCFLIAHVGRGAAADGTDTLVALNLARRVVEDHEGMSLQVADDVASRCGARRGKGRRRWRRARVCGRWRRGRRRRRERRYERRCERRGRKRWTSPPRSTADLGFSVARDLLAALRTGLGGRLPHEVFQCLTAGRAIPRSHSAYCG